MNEDQVGVESEEWEIEEVELAKPVSAVVSVRFPNDVAAHLTDEATRRGVPVSAFVRQAVTEYLASVDAIRSNYDWTVTSPDVTVSFYGGRSIFGRTGGNAQTLEDALASAARRR